MDPEGVAGVSVDVYGIRGHTAGSAAYATRGVVLLGDSGAADGGTPDPERYAPDGAPQGITVEAQYDRTSEVLSTSRKYTSRQEHSTYEVTKSFRS